MAKAKQSIVVLKQFPNGREVVGCKYEVKSLINRVTPEIGERLTTREVQALILKADTKVQIVGA